jgi:histidinol-phosphatase (PHP family)
MEATCRRALEIGLPSIAFTDHADFAGAFNEQRPVDIEGYLECVENCRRAFPEVRILSGIELGEPHLFPAEAGAMLRAGRLDRVLASVHCLRIGGRYVDMSQRVLNRDSAERLMRDFMGETLALVESDQRFDVLAHLDYPKRFWPHQEVQFVETDFEEEYWAVLRALASRESVLEINTTRGSEPVRGLCPGLPVLRWWHEVGGGAISFGSDSHEPARIASGFRLAAEVAEAAGFKPSDDPAGFWRR